jgi:hypothetical protein
VAPDGITLTRDDGIEILSSLDDACRYLVVTDDLTLLLALEDSQAILVGRLYGGLP